MKEKIKSREVVVMKAYGYSSRVWFFAFWQIRYKNILKNNFILAFGQYFCVCVKIVSLLCKPCQSDWFFIVSLGSPLHSHHVCMLADSGFFKNFLYQGGVKSTISCVFEDLKFKISEGLDQHWCFPDSA